MILGEAPASPRCSAIWIGCQLRVDGAPASGRIRRPGTAATPAQLALYRAATTPDYFAWLDHVRPAAGCIRPVLLRGDLLTVDQTTGQVLARTSTADMPDGVIYKPCGNRRATACPSCAHTYAGDAFQLVRAGISGGHGVPASVAMHPAVFATFTAPGFGPVHTRRSGRRGKLLPCRPRRKTETCPHGVELSCTRKHREDDPTLGQPLCLDCYDHSHQVIWNNHASELWRRTTIALNRQLRRIAKARGIAPDTVRVSYGKVAEMQRRGVVHFHAIIRLDGVDPDNADATPPPPAGLSTADLAEAITTAAPHAAFTTDPHVDKPGGWTVAWGTQLDIRRVAVGGGEISDRKVAAYLAKYATKSTEATGHLANRITGDTIDLYANPTGTHTERLVDACWTLSTSITWRHLRRWTHMLGFGGHFLTKSRRYSLTFRVLRDARVIWQRTHTGEPTAQTTTVIGLLTYAGAGWHHAGDALLANTAAAQARAQRQAARDALVQLRTDDGLPAIAA